MKKILYIQQVIGLFSLFFLMIPHAAAEELKITAELSSSRFSKESWSQLKVTVQGSNKAKIEVPEVSGLIIHDRGQNRYTQSINGKTTYSYSALYIIQSLLPGKYTIPPITADVGGKALQTEPIILEVLDSPSTDPSSIASQRPAKTLSTRNDSSNQREVAYVTMRPQKTSGYIGELIPVEIKAYFRTDLRELALPILHGDGVIMPELSSEPSQEREFINGQTYATLTWNTTFIGVKEGAYPLYLSLDASILLKRPRGSSSPFGDRDPFSARFFDDFFSGGYQQKNVQLKTEPITLSIKQLPSANKPESFTGAIGNFSIQTKAAPLTVEPGEPLSLTIEIAGEGNFDRVQCPEFPDKENFRVYQASGSFDETLRKKSFERAIIAKHQNIDEIPSLRFTFFDPDNEEYKEIESGPLPLHVKAVTAAAAYNQETPSQQGDVTQVKQAAPSPPPLAGMAPQKLEVGQSVSTIKPVFQKNWFLDLLFLLIGAAITLTYLGLRKMSLEANPHKVYQKRVTEQRQRSIQAIEKISNKSDTSDCLRRVRKEIQVYLGVVWKMEPSAITQADLGRKLDPSSKLPALYAQAEQGFYGGSSLTSTELGDYVTAVIEEMGKTP